jgi:hypothetical protein
MSGRISIKQMKFQNHENVSHNGRAEHELPCDTSGMMVRAAQRDQDRFPMLLEINQHAKETTEKLFFLV